jgi:ergothioneine biosynthesis protein EgtB
MGVHIMRNSNLVGNYQTIRQRTEEICSPLEKEDYVVQPIADVSPPKWHLGHTTWFFETFILKQYLDGYQEFNSQYNFVFNSYYETVGARVIRTDRGNLSRPSVDDVYAYRKYVDGFMVIFLNSMKLSDSLVELIILGFNHEQQHQELLFTDLKYILGHNPLFPAYTTSKDDVKGGEAQTKEYLKIEEGVYEIGFQGSGFCFDNELGRHKVYIQDFEISRDLITNAEFLEFINDGGYQDFRHWHAEGWDWVKDNQAEAPLYWHNLEGEWMNYTLQGLQPISAEDALCHINFYEAAAFASWKGMRLPTEMEWEIASNQLNWGTRWEWTASAYLPYPGFSKAPGAIGEYNGKFMVNQMVLRGSSVATPAGHSRNTYRNFFHPKHQWQFTGLRLAR